MRTKQPHPVSTRDPLKQLAAESPSFAKQNAEAAPAARKVREQYEREISSLPGVKTHLDNLKDRGVRLERVLKCLAAFVILENDATWQLKADANKAYLRKLAKSLVTMAEEVKGAYGADALRPDLFAMSLGGFVLAPPPYDHRKTVECLLETAADLEAKARGFGRLRKDITPVVRRQAEVALLLCCVSRPQPGGVPECPLQLRVMLAELLHEVCKKYGIKNSFTADSLLKTFKRHALSRFPEPPLDKTPSQE
jgi:hypothetical protein